MIWKEDILTPIYIKLLKADKLIDQQILNDSAERSKAILELIDSASDELIQLFNTIEDHTETMPF